MSTTTNDKAAAAVGTPATNNDTTVYTPSPLPSLTFRAVSYDLASWWCYAILRHRDLKLFDELDNVLNTLPGPFFASSPLSIRLRCLVPWQELLKQLDTPGFSVGEKQFETIQDKLLLLHQGFFSKTPAREEFNHVLRMIQTHSVLSKLYIYFSESDSSVHNDQEDATNKIMDQCNAEWERIYLESDGVPSTLLDLVDKTNGWDFEARRDHIVEIVSFPDSALTYERLKNKMQSLLLRWFKNEIIDANENSRIVPELLGKRYRGIGYGNDEKVPQDIAKSTETFCNSPTDSEGNNSGIREDTSIVVRSPIARQQQQKQKQKSRPDRRSPVKQQLQQRVSKNKRKRRNLEQDQASSVLEPSDIGNWSDSDLDEEPKRLNLHRERKKRFRNFPQEQRVSTGRRMEELLSMSVGQPSYSEASTQRTTTRDRRRKRLDDRDYRHRFTTVPTTSSAESKKEQIFSNSSISSSSRSDFGSDEQARLWTRGEDKALKNGIKWNGYGNWKVILNEEKRLLGSRCKYELRDRANLLLAH